MLSENPVKSITAVVVVCLGQKKCVAKSIKHCRFDCKRREDLRAQPLQYFGALGACITERSSTGEATTAELAATTVARRQQSSSTEAPTRCKIYADKRAHVLSSFISVLLYRFSCTAGIMREEKGGATFTPLYDHQRRYVYRTRYILADR